MAEAGLNSGALITAGLADGQGRQVYAIPGNINSIYSIGGNMLIRDGVQPLVVLDDIFQDLGIKRKAGVDEKWKLGEDEIIVMMPKKTKTKKVTVREARKILREEEAQNLIDMDQVTEEALTNAEQNGIIFIDEIDKIASGSSYGSGADVSREGVQRDILPIVEGSVVNTKHGGVPEWLKGADCKSVGYAYNGSKPFSSTKYSAEVAQG